MSKMITNIIKAHGPLIIFPMLYHYLRRNIAKLTGQKHIIRRIGPKKMKLRTSDNGISRALTLLGTREKETSYILEKIIKPGQNIFDLWANIGYYVLLQHTLLQGQGSIYAVEPEPNNFELLNQNIQLNQLTNVTTQQAAVSDHEGSIDLYLSELSNVHSVFDNHEASSGRKIQVPCLKLSKVLKQAEKPIDLIRMDIEGAEVMLFQDLIDNFKKTDKLPSLIFEVHHDKYDQKQRQQVIQGMIALGYHCPYLAVSGDHGAAHMEQKWYQPQTKLYTDGFIRYIYTDINNTNLTYCLQHTRAALFTQQKD